jgi:hypothetical protein
MRVAVMSTTCYKMQSVEKPMRKEIGILAKASPVKASP